LPATRTFSSLFFGEDGEVGGGIGDGEGVTDSLPERRKLTLDSNLRSIPPDFSLGSSTTTRSFPLDERVVIVAKSSATGTGIFLDLVAARRLCSRVERMRVNGLSVESGAEDEDEEAWEGCFREEGEEGGGGRGVVEEMRWCEEGIWKGPATFEEERTVAIERPHVASEGRAKEQ
jgi:hypothetical protein